MINLFVILITLKISDGKWTPGDRIVLSELLLPTEDDVGPLDEIIVLLKNIVKKSSAQGQRELLAAVLDNLTDRIEAGSRQ